MVILTIKVNPYISDKFSLTIYNILLRYYIIPSLNRYLDSVTKGIKFYLENGKKIEHNQFGSHKWFS